MVNDLPNLDDSDSFESDDSENEEISDFEELTDCLFCEKVSKSLMKAVEHLGDHNFNLQELRERFDMDQYDFIKVNL